MKSQLSEYRQGIFGALLDEHDKAFAEFIDLVQSVSEAAYEEIVDPDTDDPNCRSIKTICRHVVGSGYGYISLMRQVKSLLADPRYPTDDLTIDPILTSQDLPGEIDRMMRYMEETLGAYSEYAEEPWTVYITTQSGNRIDFETLLEHSVVHILRHRRQVEKFILQIRAKQ